MDSPPSSSSWSQAFILSDDSGLLLTTGSASSANTSFESKSEKKHFPFEDSDCEERSLSQDDSFDRMSDVICGENFNTLKKGPHWNEVKHSASPIDPPLEFQDRPKTLETVSVFEIFYARLTREILAMAYNDCHDIWLAKRCITGGVQEPKSLSPPPLPSRTANYTPPPLPDFLKRNSTNLSKSSSYLCRVSPQRSQSMCYPSHKRCFPSPTSSFANSASNFASSASPYVPHTPRPSSRSSMGGSSRLSSSHNSLSVPHTRRVDDSSFITQAVSHDTLSSHQISDLYNVPFDSDMYAVPLDVVHKPPLKPKRGGAYSSNTVLLGGGNKKKRKHLLLLNKEIDKAGAQDGRSYQRNMGSGGRRSVGRSEQVWCETKRHSVAGTSTTIGTEPIHMTLQEVRTYLQTLHSSSSDSSDTKENNHRKRSPNCNNGAFVINNNNNSINNKFHSRSIGCLGNNQISNRPKKSTFLKNIKNKKVKDSCENAKTLTISPIKREERKRKIFNFKQALCNIFRFRKFLSVEEKPDKCETQKLTYEVGNSQHVDEIRNTLSSRALPPLPKKAEKEATIVEQPIDFFTSLHRVKDYGWYWGPISCEAAEKILSNEPDGSFIVRDSSDYHYIFSLTFKLNNSVRHVRIEHDQGNFSFGSCTKFKSQTIVEFIENAVEHSRSGRYLFFLHRRPVIGPVRVQLLHPVSRFKQVQSLQHMCRFVIHKNVRMDLIPMLPLPRRMIDYLNTPHYYAEHFVEASESTDDNPPSSGDNTLRSGFAPPIPSNGPALTRDGTVNHPQNVPANEYIVFNPNSSVRNGGESGVSDPSNRQI
ncbi:suppressor of Cytokine Signaling at 16D isoform X2 [Rhynchophorus ferrugineus]|uniref:Suppressor of cytokine signaling 7 n=1 Tax=Rhynchophorus ferrugineus TaxID=354439 RepID=A0A834ISH1_RHYFE|nr:hypothetical protein GWI33_001631 [Rhynchophorus ferrugineus]